MISFNLNLIMRKKTKAIQIEEDSAKQLVLTLQKYQCLERLNT